MAPNLLMPALFSPLLAFLVWRRVRRQFGRQPVQRGRMLLRVVALSVVAGLLGLAGLRDARLFEGLLVGLLGGAALGLLGLRLTRFQRGADGRDLYLPNPWIGAAITALLVGRLAWRLLVLLPQAGGTALAAPPQLGSPLTMLVVGLMVGYYVSYYAGVLVHHRRFVRQGVQ